jgi:acyl-CoA synthetase (AMP-forming)/AMP-acid ligase II
MKAGLTQGLRRAEQMRRDGIAVIDGELRFTWREFVRRVTLLAGAFRALGLEEGGRVALLALNSHRSIEVYFASIFAGGVVMPLNHRLAPGEIAAQVADGEPTILVIAPDFGDHAPLLRDAAAGAVKAVVHCAAGPAPDGMVGYEAILADAEPIADAGRGGDDLACLFYTGGTTGAAKGVMLSHANILANTANFLAHMNLDERTVHLHCGPLFHVAAGVRLFSVTQIAGTHVMLPRFVAGEVLDEIARTGVTIATFVPTMIRSLLDDPRIGDRDLSSLRNITYGAAAMPEALLREAMAGLPHVRFVQFYGMTETAPIATALGWRDHLPDAAAKGRLRSAGRAALLADVIVADAYGVKMPPGESGEICVRGPMVMLGYWRKPAETTAALRDGWMRTGDVGTMDADGYLYVVDRLKDMIISGGENIYSQEVENALCLMEAVQQCAVFGRPDARWGETVHAVVVPKAGMALTPQQVVEHCRATLSGFKCPRSVEIRTEPLPLSGANKVLKTVLRAELLAADPPTIPLSGA